MRGSVSRWCRPSRSSGRARCWCWRWRRWRARCTCSARACGPRSRLALRPPAPPPPAPRAPTCSTRPASTTSSTLSTRPRKLPKRSQPSSEGGYALRFQIVWRPLWNEEGDFVVQINRLIRECIVSNVFNYQTWSKSFLFITIKVNSYVSRMCKPSSLVTKGRC